MEREIFQLSSLLTEQKNLIENLMEMTGLEKRSTCSTSTSAGSGLQNQQNYQIQILMNKLDGVAVGLIKYSKLKNIAVNFKFHG